MSIEFGITKLVVADVAAMERFYIALGFSLVERCWDDQAAGEGDVAQQQSRLSQTGDATSHLLVLARFPGLAPPPPGPDYPGAFWLVLQAADVDAAVGAALQAGGRSVRAAEDVPDPRYPNRAAIVSNPEGNFIELYGPIGAA